MLNVTSLSGTLPSSVPKPEASGTNWAIFKVRFKDSVREKGFWGHFNGITVKPFITLAPPVIAASGITYEDQLLPVSQWEKNERSSISLLTQKIPDSMLMKVYSKLTVRECWLAIEKEYMQKGAYAQTELCSQFLEMKCRTGDNVHDCVRGRLRRKTGVECSELSRRSQQIICGVSEYIW